MVINMMKLPIRELIKGYNEDDATSRVVGWGGKLDVRPEYQREYVYGDKQRDAVVNTILNGFPLNIMYFVDRRDGTYEVMDGQQRIISICRFATQSGISVKLPAKTGGFNTVNFPNLFDDTRQAFLDYELQVYVCEGTEEEKLDWFQVINIAGERLEPQEIRNALWHSAWLTDAKSYFSRPGKGCDKNYGKYMGGKCIRQAYLETFFLWAAEAEGYDPKDKEGAITRYMQAHRQDANANDLVAYAERVFAWVGKVFGKYDAKMKGVEWGQLYNEHKDDNLDPADIQRQVADLMADDEVSRKHGIYEYLLTGERKHLSLRTFSEKDKATMYARQSGRCAVCGKQCDGIKEMHADHVTPWWRGGVTELSNGQMLCRDCNLKKGGQP